MRLSTLTSDYQFDMPERAQKNCLFKICYKIASHHMFTGIITLLIFVNTGVLALDQYPEP